MQNWFLANHASHGMVLENGWPTKKSKGGAEGAFQIMAGEEANTAGILGLCQELLGHNIWPGARAALNKWSASPRKMIRMR